MSDAAGGKSALSDKLGQVRDESLRLETMLAHRGMLDTAHRLCNIRVASVVAAERERLATGPHPDYPCRHDGRCQYAIDHGAEGLGHCPRGKCVMREETPNVEFSSAPAEHSITDPAGGASAATQG